IVMIVTAPRDLRTEQKEAAEFLCASGETRSCQSGSCAGTSTCIQGVWSGCRWERICTPGIHEPCIEQGCAYALRECNECGTGWGECLPLDIQ
ncbi:MAG: hypothetical protein ACOY58_06220, partial [Candidatus Micrarchaeota archaeon]